MAFWGFGRGRTLLLTMCSRSKIFTLFNERSLDAFHSNPPGTGIRALHPTEPMQRPTDSSQGMQCPRYRCRAGSKIRFFRFGLGLFTFVKVHVFVACKVRVRGFGGVVGHWPRYRYRSILSSMHRAETHQARPVFTALRPSTYTRVLSHFTFVAHRHEFFWEY
jgi:hypothetical protein